MTEHLPIQRWTKIFTRYPASEILPNENGEYVTYADHLDALRACEKRMLATLKQTQNDVESELNDSGYRMFKEFKKEVFVRVRDALRKDAE